MITRFLLFFFLLSLVACGGVSEEIPLLEFPDDPDGLDPAVVQAYSVPLTKQAMELRRVKDEHLSLIESIPPTEGPTPTFTVTQMQLVVADEVVRFPDGVPVSRPEDEVWFNPNHGLVFFRTSGGDWSDREHREQNPYAPLFYQDSYPEGVRHFADGSIYPAIAREMAFEASDVLPVLGDPNPDMVQAFADNLGWELRNSESPVINVWTEFLVRDRLVTFRYSVGGVMMMGINTLGDDGMQTLVPGRWLGPVVVERLR